MNWTEGNLNRLSRVRRGKEVILRQKEHFAKVRAGLLDANVKISPPSISFPGLPAHPPFSVRRESLKSGSSGKHQSDDRLMSSRYFSENGPKSPSPIRLPNPETEDEAIRQKRRKLLLKGDWVGTNVQKPIKMEFTKARAFPNNPWGGKKKARHQASKQKLRRLLGVTQREVQDTARPSAADSFTPTLLRRIKVHVGSYEGALGGSSNASLRANGNQLESPGPCEPKYLHRWNHHQDRDQVCVPISDASYRSHSSASQTPLLTTSPLLFHPVPTRPALVQLLHQQSVGLGNADSTLGQLGVEQTLVQPSQADENDMWRAFVAGPDPTSALDEMSAFRGLGDASERLISPGISQFGVPRKLNGTDSPEATISLEVKDSSEGKTPATPASPSAKTMRPDPSHRQGSESSSDDDGNASLADDYSPAGLGSDVSQPGESPRQGGRHDEHFEEPDVAARSSGEESLLVVTSSPKLPPSLDMVGEATPFPMDQPGHRSIELDSPSREMTKSPPYGKAEASRDRICAAVEKELPSERAQEDESDMWKKFVFGDSCENAETALEEARRDTARNLRPSLPSTSSYSGDEFQNGFITSSIDHESIESRGFADGLYDTLRDVATTASASHVATAGASSAGISSEAISVSVEATARTDQATDGSLSSSATSNSMSRVLVSNDPGESAICEAGTSTSSIDPKRLERHNLQDECFKFARPKLFVGKKMEHVDEQRQIALSEPQLRRKSQTRRRQRRTTDGRANIRKLPNCGSDPIEEFVEGDCRSDRAEKGSMLSALETEDGL